MVTVRQQTDVAPKAATVNDLVVPLMVILGRKQNIISKSREEDPRRLSAVAAGDEGDQKAQLQATYNMSSRDSAGDADAAL